MRPALLLALQLQLLQFSLSTEQQWAPVPLATGWADCSGTAPDAHSVQRAWRRLSRESHPDKVGGDGAQFEDMTALRDALKQPDQFQLHKVLHNLTALTPFGQHAIEGPAHVATGNAEVVQKCGDVLDRATCFPYLALSVELSLGAPLPVSARWTVALGVKGVSSIQYQGDEKLGGGYDACCDFVADSNCVLRPPSVPGMSPVDALPSGCGEGAVSGQCADKELPAAGSTVKRPLPPVNRRKRTTGARVLVITRLSVSWWRRGGCLLCSVGHTSQV